MNTTTNTRGVSEAMYTPEKVEAIAQELYKAPATSMWGSRVSVPTDKTAAAYEALIAYAATLRQNPERRVSSEEVRLSLDYSRNFARANPRLSKTTVEHIEGLCNLVERLAAPSAEPAAQGEAIGEVRENGVTWFRDNPHAFPIGTKFYTAPPAQPTERAPEGFVAVRRASLSYRLRELNGARRGDNAQHRADFEAWLISEHGYAPEDLIWQESRNCYADYAINLACNAYLAAHADLSGEVRELVDGYRSLYRGYVNTLEVARDRITSLGGECDPLDVMEIGDPALSLARERLAKFTHQEKP